MLGLFLTCWLITSLSLLPELFFDNNNNSNSSNDNNNNDDSESESEIKFGIFSKQAKLLSTIVIDIISNYIFFNNLSLYFNEI